MNSGYRIGPSRARKITHTTASKAPDHAQAPLRGQRSRSSSPGCPDNGVNPHPEANPENTAVKSIMVIPDHKEIQARITYLAVLMLARPLCSLDRDINVLPQHSASAQVDLPNRAGMGDGTSTLGFRHD